MRFQVKKVVGIENSAVHFAMQRVIQTFDCSRKTSAALTIRGSEQFILTAVLHPDELVYRMGGMALFFLRYSFGLHFTSDRREVGHGCGPFTGEVDLYQFCFSLQKKSFVGSVRADIEALHRSVLANRFIRHTP